MIGEDRRKAIVLLHKEGMELRAIARRLHVSRNTVRAIVEAGGAVPARVRSDKLALDEQLLRGLYGECAGYITRVHEKLLEAGIKVAYPTLTHRLRDLGISPARRVRCEERPDEPGAEMQHDTSVYRVKLGERSVSVIASLLYLRYSKRRYLKFYPRFNRFRMKCFLHEALLCWGHSARQCIIDNTNLARLSGTGSGAVIVPEMAAFAKGYGFEFVCHALGHANRKAGEERGFFTGETNFFPGRTFQSLEDLNAQALDWASVRMENRVQGKTGVIPAKAFEHERALLRALPPHLPAPYRIHERDTDQYGYAAFEGNYYWVPGTRRELVRVVEYAERIKLYRERVLLAEYALPPDGTHNRKFAPPGEPGPRANPEQRRGSEPEEKHLRALGPAVGLFLDFALPRQGRLRHEFARKLLGLSRRIGPELFLRCVERAHKYRIADLATVERIAHLYFLEAAGGALPHAPVDGAFTQRAQYREGELTSPPDLSIYDSP
jgi:transposase